MTPSKENIALAIYTCWGENVDSLTVASRLADEAAGTVLTLYAAFERVTKEIEALASPSALARPDGDMRQGPVSGDGQTTAAVGSDPATATNSEWRPIETVPKNKTEVLLWSVGSKYLRPGRYIGHYDYLFRDYVPIIGCTVYSTNPEQFTHWAPLPDPPECCALSSTERKIEV